MSNIITNLRDLIFTYQEYRSDTEISHMLGIDAETIKDLRDSLEGGTTTDLCSAKVSFEK